MRCLLFALTLALLLPRPAHSAGVSRWFRGVESVNKPSASIDESILLRVRDLDGWLLTEMERRHLTGEKHFTGNQFELFLSQRQQARSVGKDYGDLMQDEQERLNEEFERLRKRRLKIAAAKQTAKVAAPVAAAAAAEVQPEPPVATPLGPVEDEASLAKARAKALADQEIWFAKWQAFQGYQRLLHEVKENLYLILNGHRLTRVKARNPFDGGVDENTVTIHFLEFVLKQDPADKAEWDKLYDGTTRFSPSSVTVGFDMDGRSFTLDTEVQPASSQTAPSEKEGETYHRFGIVTYSMGSLIYGLGLVAVAFVAFLYLAARTDLVRDPDGAKRPDGLAPFSLARCQMAFWFFLFAAAYVFLWVVKRQTDTLTDQCLVLMGISTGTTLGVAVLAKVGSKDAPKPATEAGVGEPRETYIQRPAFQRFFEDILSDHNQLTFHRFQMAVWTLVLGFVFIRSVCWALQMPQFGTNELTLMGISAGTYVGFTIPGPSQKPAVPPAAPPASPAE